MEVSAVGIRNGRMHCRDSGRFGIWERLATTETGMHAESVPSVQPAIDAAFPKTPAAPAKIAVTKKQGNKRTVTTWKQGADYPEQHDRPPGRTQRSGGQAFEGRAIRLQPVDARTRDNRFETEAC